MLASTGGLEAFASCFWVACKTVHDAGQTGGFPVSAQDVNRVGPGVASMNDDGQVEFLRNRKLTAEHFALNVARRVVVVVIETSLADRDNFILP